MTIRYDSKDPDAELTVEFDFGTPATNPAVTVAVFSGTDAGAASMLVGTPTVLGNKVLQRIRAGLHGVDYALECFADVAGGRISIDAILPVRDRPIADAAVPRYCTEAQFERRFGQRELADLLANGHGFAQAENDCASTIDGYLSARYALPLATVPAIVTGICADLTRYRLWDQAAPEEVRKRYEDALRQLRDIVDGRLSLPPDASGSAPAGGMVFDGYCDERVFTAETLKGFVG